MNRNDRHTRADRDRIDDRQTRTENRQNRTDRRDRTDDPITAGSTMRDVSHTHPYTDRGALNRVFERGTRVAADGGERNAVSRTSEDERSESSGSERNAGDPERREYDARNPDEDADEESGADAAPEADDETGKERMKDIDHTPPHGEGVERVFERGGTEEPVEAEE